MTNFKEQLHKATKDIRLSDAEKRDMRAALSRAMGTPSPVKVVRSPYVFLSHTWMRALAALVLVVFTGGSTAFAAQGALPGEPLYALKTKVLEQAQLALASDAAAKATVHAQLAERRIEEAEALAEKGALDATSSEMLAADFDAHSNAAVALADEASQSDPSVAVEIETRVRASSSAGSAVLVALAKKNGSGSVREHSEGLAVRILARAESGSGSARSTALAAPAAKTMAFSATADATATAEVQEPQSERTMNPMQGETAARLQEKAAKALADARKALESSSELDANTTTEVQASLSKIDELMAEGANYLGADAFEDSVRSFTEAYARAVKLQVLLKAQKSFNNNVVEPLLKFDNGDDDEHGGPGQD